MSELDVDDAAVLARVAGLLDTVGRNADQGASAVAVHCLHAVDLFAAIGISGLPSPMQVGSGDSVVAVREALRLLSTLSDNAFVLPAVVGATDAAQRALRAVTIADQPR
jgi:hypothetical protein